MVMAQTLFSFMDHNLHISCLQLFYTFFSSNMYLQHSNSCGYPYLSMPTFFYPLFKNLSFLLLILNSIRCKESLLLETCYLYIIFHSCLFKASNLIFVDD